MRYYIIAGEASGDLHGSNLIKGLFSSDKDAVIRFWGGDFMLAAYNEGVARRDKPGSDGGLVRDYKATAIMGFFEILTKAGSILNNLADCKKDIADFKPDAVILIDYPGFNLKIAQWAHNNDFKVFYYIAPKVWASREGRIEKIKKYVDTLFIVFPFEKEYFASKGVPYIYCGNPLVEEINSCGAMTSGKDEIKAQLELEPNERCIALLAGSRHNEVKTMMPLYKEVVELLSPKFPNYKFIIAGAPGRKEEDYGEFDSDRMRLVFGKTREIVRISDVAVINSGTASLEAVLLGTPQVVAYKVASTLTYYLAKWFLLKCKYISLGNLCLNKLAFKELYSKEDCTAENVANEVTKLITDLTYRDHMLEDYKEIAASLEGDGASLKVAGKITELCRDMPQEPFRG